MLSAPATIRPTSEATFNASFAPLSVGPFRCWVSEAGTNFGSWESRGGVTDD